MKITFIGTGYVGLVSGVMMSHLGHDVVCLDIDSKKIENLKKGIVPIFEPGLDEYIKKYANTSRLQFTDKYDSIIQDSDCVFITVGTPPKEDGDADLQGVFEAIDSLCKIVSSECVIVIKSTVPPGTCLNIQEYLRSNNLDNEVASNPEFLREGSAIQDFLKPDRIVIGAESEHVFAIMRKCYKNLLDQGVPIVETDLKTSELIKYASNTFLANKIAFINEMADLCEIVGADITKLSEGIGRDKRIGMSFLNPGPGFGGSCFPKDILALQKLSQKVNSEFLVLDAIIKSNSNRPQNLIKKIISIVGGSLKDKKIAVLGLTYKAGTDDIRSSPSIELIKYLKENQANVIAYDPEGMDNAPKYFDNLLCADSAIEGVKDSECVIIITEWEEFKNIDYTKVKSSMMKPVIIDLRNILVADEMKKLGFDYYSIGRKYE